MWRKIIIAGASSISYVDGGDGYSGKRVFFHPECFDEPEPRTKTLNNGVKHTFTPNTFQNQIPKKPGTLCEGCQLDINSSAPPPPVTDHEHKENFDSPQDFIDHLMSEGHVNERVLKRLTKQYNRTKDQQTHPMTKFVHLIRFFSTLFDTHEDGHK